MANALQLIGGSVLKGLESHTKERKVIRITDIARKESNMADKVQKIKDWISKTQDGLMDVNGNFENSSNEGAFHILSNLDYYIDSLQEEHVSEDLGDYINKLSKQFPEVSFAKLSRIAVRVAKWQKEQIKKAMDLGEPPYLISIEQAYYRTLKLLEE